jgi:hypothetical protein
MMDTPRIAAVFLFTMSLAVPAAAAPRNKADAALVKPLAIRDVNLSNANGMSDEAIIAIVMGLAAVIVPLAIFILTRRERTSPRSLYFTPFSGRRQRKLIKKRARVHRRWYRSGRGL